MGRQAGSALFPLELKTVGDHGDELAVGGLPLDVGDGVAEVFLQCLQIPAVPGHLNGVADGPRSTREAVVPKRLATSG